VSSFRWSPSGRILKWNGLHFNLAYDVDYFPQRMWSWRAFPGSELLFKKDCLDKKTVTTLQVLCRFCVWSNTWWVCWNKICCQFTGNLGEQGTLVSGGVNRVTGDSHRGLEKSETGVEVADSEVDSSRSCGFGRLSSSHGKNKKGDSTCTEVWRKQWGSSCSYNIRGRKTLGTNGLLWSHMSCVLGIR